MPNHLEQLISEWFEWKDYVVRRNVKVGKRPRGGYIGELDVVAYSHERNHLIQVEPSIDPHTWAKREERFKKKFDAGKKYILDEVFPWVPHNKKFEQWAVLWASNKNHKTVGGGEIVPVWDLYRLIAKDILDKGGPNTSAIPEQFPLLRTMQHTLSWVKPEELAAGRTSKKS